MKVIGITEKKGDYEGREYHNVMIHCTKEDDSAFGQLSEVIKVKYSNVIEVFGKPMSAADWQQLIGKKVFVSYNRYGVVQDVTVMVDTDKK